MTKAGVNSSKLLNNDFIDKLASDQVGKMTKKLNLSENQQTQANKLVMDQLRSEKFQKMLSKYTPDQLMSSKGSSELTSALLKDDGFSSQLSGILDKKQLGLLKLF
jgi:hypothetical protein